MVVRRRAHHFKRATAPAVTRSMHTAAEDLGLSELCVVHAGKGSGALAKGIRAVAFDRLLTDLKPLG